MTQVTGNNNNALQVIIAISDYPGIRSTALREYLDISQATLTRALAQARHLGTVITYSHEDGYLLESGNVRLARKWLELNEETEPLA